MSTTLGVFGVAVPGIVLLRERDPTSKQRQEWAVFGLNGANQLVGGFEPEDIELLIWLMGFATAAAIEAWLDANLRPLVGRVGSIVLSGGVSQTLTDMGLLQLTSGVEHDEQRGPLPNNPATPMTPWTDHLRLRFRKLR